MESAMPLLTIVVPIYNEKEQLEKFVKSIEKNIKKYNELKI